MNTSKDEMEFSELQALGVPLDGGVVERSRTAELGLRIHLFQAGIDCTIFDAQFGGTFVMIHVVISNDSPQVVRLDQCRIELPWLDPSPNAPTLPFERDAVINHRFGHQGRLSPGDSLDGMLLGAGSKAIPDQYQHREGVKVQLLIVDGQGKVYQENPRVMLDRSEQLRREKKARVLKR
jgi:hypothetical protein